MADESSESRFKIPKWGPKTLRNIFQLIEDRINAITPKAGLGVNVSREPDGTLIHYQEAIDAMITGQEQGGSGGSGDFIAIYGAHLGAPAVFHLLQDSPPAAP